MRIPLTRLFSALILALSVPGVAVAQTPSADPRFRNVMLLARDAALQLHAGDPSEFVFVLGGDDARHLVHWLRLIGEDEAAARLNFLFQTESGLINGERFDLGQQARTPQDLAALVAEIEVDPSAWRRDARLAAIARQRIEESLLNDAETIIGHIQSPQEKSRLFGQIALALHQTGNEAAAQQAVRAAFESALHLDRANLSSPYTNLDLLAGLLHFRKYEEGLRTLLSLTKSHLQSGQAAPGLGWAALAQIAINVKALGVAEDALHEVADKNARDGLVESINLMRARTSEPEVGVGIAAMIEDPEFRSELLCDIARRQLQAGDRAGAGNTLRLALQAAAETAPYRAVLLMNDVAWVQIESGDLESANKTVNWALQVNEQLDVDQDNGWVAFAETLTRLGRISEAHVLANRTKFPSEKARAQGSIAFQQVYRQGYERTLAWANHLQTTEERVKALLGIAEALARILNLPESPE